MMMRNRNRHLASCTRSSVVARSNSSISNFFRMINRKENTVDASLSLFSSSTWWSCYRSHCCRWCFIPSIATNTPKRPPPLFDYPYQSSTIFFKNCVQVGHTCGGGCGCPFLSVQKRSIASGSNKQQKDEKEKEADRRSRNENSSHTMKSSTSSRCEGRRFASRSGRLPEYISQGDHQFTWQRRGRDAATPVDIRQPRTIAHKLKMLIMPRGFPHTVAPGFQQFFFLAIINSMVTSFSMQVATRSLLSGFFTDSTPGTWMLKDLVPTLFSAVIANFIVSYENRAKYWFVMAALFAQFGAFLELCIPFVVPPKYFLLAAATTSLMKGSAGLMFGVTRATFLQHFATAQNMGEITKKITSVGMVIYTSFGAIGLAFSTFFPQFWVQLSAMVVCSVISLYVSYTAVKPVHFKFLTAVTTPIILEAFLKSNYTKVPTPEEVSKQLGVKGYIKTPSSSSSSQGHVSERRKYQNAVRHLLLIGPRIKSIEITDDSFAEALTLFSPRACKFTIGVWAKKATKVQKKVEKALDAEKAAMILKRGTNVSGATEGSEKQNLHNSVSETPSENGRESSKRASMLRNKRLRLVLLLHKDCELKHLLTGLLICHAALEAMTKEGAANPSSNTKEKKSPLPSNPHIVREVLNDFLLNQGSRVIKEWSQRAELLLLQMKTSGWETNSYQIDPATRRIHFTWDEKTKFQDMDDCTPKE